MGFCIWVADDPELADALSPYGSDPQVEPVPSNYPYFSASMRAMSALRQEMAAQGFAIVDAFVFNNGDHVPAEEIDLALRESVEVPLTLHDPEGIELWRDWLSFLRLASREHGGVVVQ